MKEFFRRKSDECRAEQSRLAEQIKTHQEARKAYIVDVADLAQRAAELFQEQTAHEKRKLLRYVVTDCRWKAGALSYEYKPPFEHLEIAEAEAA